jgi:hypothetical protein
MKRLTPFFALSLMILLLLPVVFAQGETIRDAVADTTASVNRLLQHGTESVEVGALVANDIFNEADSWELYEGDDGAYLRVSDGVYELYQEGSGTIWGQSLMAHTDIVMQVEVEQLSSFKRNGYGLMCRADTQNDRDGYHFWISGNGFATIFKLVDGELDELVDWTEVQAIRRGEAKNLLTVVCVGDYLALYANSELLLEAHDDEYQQGVAGVSAALFTERRDVHITYDNFRMWTVATNDEREFAGSIRALVDDPDALLPALNRMLEQGDEPVEIARLDDYETFDADNGDWFISDFDEGEISIANGVYRLLNDGSEPDFTLLFGENFSRHSDVVIQVTARNLENNTDSYAGVTCRSGADNNILTGYTFWVGSDGFYTIIHADERDTDELTRFSRSDAIGLGAAENEITVVCSGSYLALYINGQLVDEVQDERITQGITALSAAYLNDTGSFDVTFDNVRIWEVER